MKIASLPSASESALMDLVEDVLAATPAVDMHTHLFAPRFGPLGLWGIDHLLTYHYLEAEFFRFSSLTPAEYYSLDLSGRADAIWRTLFVENPPLSEATRGVLAVLDALGLETDATTLAPLRTFFRSQHLGEHLPRVFRLAGVSRVVMTNDPLDPEETPFWDNPEGDPLFAPALRLDRLLNLGAIQDPAEARSFLEYWCRRMRPLYMAVSLPDTFAFPEDSLRGRLLATAVLPVCRESGLPLALMIGVRRQVNPALRLAGDASGRADLKSLENICAAHPENRFLVSVLSLENQHELCVLARKFANLRPFGCWWFLNNTSLVEEITRQRLEMLGVSFIAQNSDARVLEQLIYKWRNTRRALGSVLSRQFALLKADGGEATRPRIEAAATRLLRTNFEDWTHT